MHRTPLTLQQIADAVDAGHTVHWRTTDYTVRKGPAHQDAPGNYANPALRYTIDHANGQSLGLTWRDGVTLNGKECDFYISD